MTNQPRYRVLAEVVSALAVVLSLIFVGLQLRETSRQSALNTVSLQVGAYQDLNAQISHFNELLMDPRIAAVWDKMMDTTQRWSDFRGAEHRQARSLLFIRVRHADMAYYEYERGILSRERFESALRPLSSDVHNPMFLEFWNEVGPNQVPGFRKYIDAKIAERP